MTRIGSAVIAAIALVAATAPASAGQPKGEAPEVVSVNADDAGMNAAIAQARATLGEFLRRLDTGQLTPDDMLKVEMPTPGGSEEHIWVADIRRQGSGFTGRLANDPIEIPYQRGHQVTFTSDMISDWSYEAHGRLWGNFTTRFVLPRLSPRQAAELRDILSETPVEP